MPKTRPDSTRQALRSRPEVRHRSIPRESSVTPRRPLRRESTTKKHYALRIRSDESVIADLHKEQALMRVERSERTYSHAFARIPLVHRVFMIVAIYALAVSIAGSAYILHLRTIASKRSVYVAADGRGGREMIQLLSVPSDKN